MPDICICEIVDKKKLTEQVFSITFKCKQIAQVAFPGQFVSIKCGEERLLRRPISISNATDETLTIVFDAKGEGTRWLSERTLGDNLNVLGPLGKGFDIPNGDIVVVGGGIGTPPLLFASKSSKGKVVSILGFSDSSRIILKEDFESICDNVIITTDDGSNGRKGTVIDPLMQLLERGTYSAVLACGPNAMLRAIAELCEKKGVPTQLSLEERMACGVGACVVCACATTIDGTAAMSRVCKDGPVFPGEQIRWENDNKKV